MVNFDELSKFWLKFTLELTHSIGKGFSTPPPPLKAELNREIEWYVATRDTEWCVASRNVEWWVDKLLTAGLSCRHGTWDTPSEKERDTRVPAAYELFDSIILDFERGRGEKSEIRGLDCWQFFLKSGLRVISTLNQEKWHGKAVLGWIRLIV